MNSKFSNIDEYIESQPDETKRALSEVRKCILKAAPGAVEIFNYNIPAFSLVENGKRDQQIMMAGYRNHVGFYPHPSVMEHFDAELKDYKKGKGSVQFPNDRPVPGDLIIRMVKYRLELLKKE
ncbi:MAG: DUF1801 domain-containing protein [Spirochaetes bacterium]|nr:DUF1801 domain-containing protein [Spirochaetota bacterium]